MNLKQPLQNQPLVNLTPKRAENLSKLLQLITTIEAYNPNTEDLKLENLTIYQTSLVNATQAVNQTKAELNTALIARNTILF